MLAKFKKHNESGAAAIYAITFMIVILAFTMIATQTMLTSVTVTRTVSQQSHYQAAADTALANAVWVANNAPSDFTLATAAAPQTGSVDDQTKWSWYSELVNPADSSKGYKVTAKGYADITALNSSASITVTAKLMPRHVYKATCSNNCSKITYYPIEGGYFEHGIHSSGALTLSTNTIFKSFESSTGVMPTTSTVSTNNVVVSAAGSISGSSTNFSSILKLNTYDNTTCPIVNSKSLCDMVITEKRSYDLVGANGILNMKDLCTGTPTAWVSSANNGVLSAPASGVCYSSMLFDANTTIDTSNTVENPLRIVVLGDIIVNSGVSVNKTGSPKKLKLFVGGTALLKGGDDDHRTYFSGEIAANNVNLSTSRYGTFYGNIWSNTNLNIMWDSIWYDTDSIYQANSLVSYVKTQYVISSYKISESIRDASLTGGGN